MGVPVLRGVKERCHSLIGGSQEVLINHLLVQTEFLLSWEKNWPLSCAFPCPVRGGFFLIFVKEGLHSHAIKC